MRDDRPLLFGAIVPVDLRLMGLRRAVPIQVMTRTLLPLAISGLVLAIVAGLLLFSVRAVEYASTTLLQVKIALVACVLLNVLFLHRAAQWEPQHALLDAAPPLRLRMAGALSMGLWLSVIVCGRMLAFVD